MGFRDKVRQKGTKGDSDSRVKIVESENDFPMFDIHFVRVGSAHAVAHHDGIEPKLGEILRRFCDEIAKRYEPNALGQAVTFVWKEG